MTTTINNPAPSTIRRRRKKWLEALRSGDFLQGKNNLKKKSKGKIRHCCLGVASEVCGLDSTLLANSDVFQFVDGDYKEAQFLPGAAQVWLGFASDNPRINLLDSEGQATQLSALNDRGGWSFAKIADAIEKYGFHEQDDLLKAAGRA